MSQRSGTVNNERKELQRAGGSGVAMNHREGKYIASPGSLSSTVTRELNQMCCVQVQVIPEYFDTRQRRWIASRTVRTIAPEYMSPVGASSTGAHSAVSLATLP
jgi:hypothetical protein